MSLVDQLMFHAWDATGMIEKIIKRWKPGKLKNEKAYEKSLYDFLHAKLDDIQVTKQSAKGRIRADIVVGDKVIVEIKNNLDSTAKYQRLVGQLTEYKSWNGEVIIVLCGKTDRNLRKELDSFLKDFKAGSFSDAEVRVIQKK